MKENVKAVLALGFFDSVHAGHRQVISEAKRIAEQLSAKPVIVSFDGNLKAAVKGDAFKCVYSTEERKKLFSETGVKDVWFAPVNKEFLSLKKEEFLKLLNEKFNVCGYVCGKDYRFGFNGQGNVLFLKDFAESSGQKLKIVEDVFFEGVKVSTSYVKDLLSSGDVEKAGKILCHPYFITGKVGTGRGVGRNLGFPTANISIGENKYPIKNGVYEGYSQIGGKTYNAVINYGGAPTFGIAEVKAEAYFIDFNKDLYGQEITLYFKRFLRETEKFSNAAKLKERVEKDVLSVMEKRYD